MSKICLLGGLGHIGSSLYPRLLQMGHDITVIDNLATQRYASLMRIPKPFKFIEGDILSLDLDRIVGGQDIVIHLAAITDAAGTASDPARVWGVNLHGTERVVMACDRAGCRLVFPSTTSVYGKSDDIVDETCEELKPQSPYASSKLEAERIARTLDGAAVLRLGTIYGESIGMRFHTAVNGFALSSIFENPIKVWRTAWRQVRPYLYLGDAISAIEHVLDKNLSGTYNVVTENSTPEEIIRHISEWRDVRVEYTDSPIMNLLSYGVSSEKLCATGWKPRGSLKDGIAETMRVFEAVNG